jgi:RNA-directed DNA polymerase
MIKTPIDLQDLRRKIYIKAKSESQWRFWGLYVHICKMETLQGSYRLAKRNKGAPGIDGVTFEEVEVNGVDKFLATIQADLLNRKYQPMGRRKVKIPKANGKAYRELLIPTIRDRVVAGAVKLILEPIFEADFQEGSFGYRPKRQASEVMVRVTTAIQCQNTKIIDVDIADFFGNIYHDKALTKIAQRVNDKDVLRLVKQILKTTGKRGLPQGDPLSPLISNVYLNDIDKMLEKAKLTTKTNGYENVEYVRFADDLLIMVSGHRSSAWIISALMKRLREELGKLGLKLNEQKTKKVDFTDPKQSFHFLGFDYRRCQTQKGKVGIRRTPRRQARIKLQREIKRVFKTKRGRPIKEVIEIINPMLRGWVNYFRIGNSAKCFSIIKDWVEGKVRRHTQKARKKQGFGWKRWSTAQLYLYTGLHNDYVIRYKVAGKSLQLNRSHKL